MSRHRGPDTRTAVLPGPCHVYKCTVADGRVRQTTDTITLHDGEREIASFMLLNQSGVFCLLAYDVRTELRVGGNPRGLLLHGTRRESTGQLIGWRWEMKRTVSADGGWEGVLDACPIGDTSPAYARLSPAARAVPAPGPADAPAEDGGTET